MNDIKFDLHELRAVNIENNQKYIDEFAKLKVELIHAHTDYANKVNINDTISSEYNTHNALKHLNEENYYQWLIMNKHNNTIGYIEFKKMKSSINNIDTLYINGIYIIPEFRHHGIGTQIIKNLMNYENKKYNIELEAWYQLDAEKLYKKLGFQPMYTHYIYQME